MFAKRVAGRHSCGFVHVLGAVEKLSFLNDFGSISLLGGTPGASRAPLGAQVGSQVDFFTIFRRPGEVFGAPLGSPGRTF